MVEAYLELGLTHQERREHNQALDVYQRAIEAVPNDYRAYFQVGVALKESKDYLGAEKMLRRAAELTTDDPGIHRLLAAVVALNLVHSHREFSGDSRVNV
jgi:tetratricopeptide (TPR) repeat protein